MQSSKLKAALSWRMLIQFFFGISSGLPLLLIGSTLQAWMTEEKIDLKTIGLFSLVGIPYTFKFVWAPVMDRFVPPFLGRRRGWILTTQILLAAAVAVLSLLSPEQSTTAVALGAVVIAFLSASQDIVLDAYRREILTNEELGLGSSFFVNGYRIGMLISGAFALMLADHLSWHTVYLILSGAFLLATAITFLAPNPDGTIVPPHSMKEAVIDPLIEYFRRKGAIEVLLFILLYKIGDSMAANLTTPLYLNLGFTKTEIGAIVKTFGLGATLLGGFAGGLLMLRWSMKRSLVVFGILQAVSTLGFAVLANLGRNVAGLTGVIAFENLTSGMGTSAFVAFMASLTNKRFTAWQYALLTSLMGVPRVIIAAPTGYLQTSVGWINFFVICALLAVPGLILAATRFSHWTDATDN
jgi:PAT family beta-lactamase induction signal transducer AmpG